MVKKIYSTNYSSYHFNYCILSEINNICRPIFDNFNIKNFRYMKCYDDGRYFSLGTNLDYIKYYLQNVSGLGNVFGPPLYATEFDTYRYYLWPSDPKYIEKTRDNVLRILFEHNMWNGISILRRKKDFVESWNFTANRDDNQMGQFYINNIALLKRFIFYFMEKAKNLIENDAGKLAIYKDHLLLNKIDQDNLQKDKIYKFLQQTKLNRFSIQGSNNLTYLTRGEFECLYHLCGGKNIKETALLRNCSPRTVEELLNRIKYKTGFTRKTDLLNIFNLDQLLSLL